MRSARRALLLILVAALALLATWGVARIALPPGDAVSPESGPASGPEAAGSRTPTLAGERATPGTVFGRHARSNSCC